MKTIVSVIALIVFAALLAFGSFQLGRFYQRPLAEPLALERGAAAASPTATPAAAQAAQPEKKGPCGETGRLMILFTGADFSGGVWPLGADAVRVVRVDFDNPSIVSVAFPRDLWLKTPVLADQDISNTRLGLVYHYKKEATLGSDKHRVTAASGAVAQTLVDNFNLQADKYFTLQLDSVAEMIDTIGGVPVNNPEEFTTENGVTFPAGEQVLDGRLSTEFVRAYQPGGDPGRRARQTLFVKALQDKVVSADVLSRVPDLVKQFDKAIVTDLSPKQLTALACMAKEVPTGAVEYYEIDETLTTPLDVGEPIPALAPNVEAILARLKEWLDL